MDQNSSGFFQMLEESPGDLRRRRRSLGLSAGLQVFLLGALVHFVTSNPLLLQPARQFSDLILLAPPPVHPPARVVPPPVPAPPPPVMHRLTTPPPRPVPVREAAHMTPPPVPRPEPVKATEAVPHFDAPDAAPAPRAPVKLDSFAATAAAAPHPEHRQLEATGFGDPASPLTGQNPHGNVSAAGFDLPTGASGAARTGTIASAGFGSVTASGTSAHGHGTVASAGFGSALEGQRTGQGAGGDGAAIHSAGFDEAPSVAVAATPRAIAPATTPVEILSKPNPTYTAEARQLRIQGVVVLQVAFQTNGQLRVERVVQGLGHGLDQAAIQAAQAMRFRPARRGNAPIETAALLHVTFQLAQ
ncbi:MAG TPA: TonB family protein [Terriglobales bacterium]|nr:TonB family protein [Terriglobales bacterium]